MLELALQYARLGRFVFPLQPGSKKPHRGSRGFKDATRDEQIIQRMWAAHPGSNVGCAPDMSGEFVVDLDVKHGEDGPGNWQGATLALDVPEGPKVRTVSGGHHLWLRGSVVSSTPRRDADPFGTGVDFRGVGGYVVMPGSRLVEVRNADGAIEQQAGIYAEDPGRPLGAPEHTPAAPGALLALVRSRKGAESRAEVAASAGVPAGTNQPPRNPPGLLDHAVVQPLGQAGMGAALNRELGRMRTAAPGTRNPTLNEVSFALSQIFGESAAAGSVQHAIRDAARQTGLGDAEIEPTLASGWNAGKSDPRAIEAPKPPAANMFEPLDLTTWLAQDHPAPSHFGAGRVLYEGGFTLLMGEPESGKSVLAYGWALDVIRSGRKVLLLDEEAGPLDALGKMRALGATNAELAAGLVYLGPLGRNVVEQVGGWAALVRAVNPALVIVDSFAAVLANSGMDENANADVTRFVNTVLLPVTQQVGAAVVVVDHMTKAAGAVGSRFSRGASSKLGLVDLALNVRASQPFSKDRSGTVEVKVTKDRWGDFGREAEWSVTVGTGDGRIVLSFLRLSEGEMRDRAAEGRSDVADRQMAQVLAAVAAAMPDGLTQAGLERALRGRDGARGLGSNVIRDLVEQAEGDGRLVRGGRNVSGRWSLVVPKPDDNQLDGVSY